MAAFEMVQKATLNGQGELQVDVITVGLVAGAAVLGLLGTLSSCVLGWLQWRRYRSEPTFLLKKR